MSSFVALCTVFQHRNAQVSPFVVKSAQGKKVSPVGGSESTNAVDELTVSARNEPLPHLKKNGIRCSRTKKKEKKQKRTNIQTKKTTTGPAPERSFFYGVTKKVKCRFIISLPKTIGNHPVLQLLNVFITFPLFM